jgi:hypothetical protein
MNLQRRIADLERVLAREEARSTCSECKYPNPQGPDLIEVEEGQEPASCALCGEVVDGVGRAVGSEEPWAKLLILERMSSE